METPFFVGFGECRLCIAASHSGWIPANAANVCSELISAIKKRSRSWQNRQHHQPIKPMKTVCMKCSKTTIRRKIQRIKVINFDDQDLTSFAALMATLASNRSTHRSPPRGKIDSARAHFSRSLGRQQTIRAAFLPEPRPSYLASADFHLPAKHTLIDLPSYYSTPKTPRKTHSTHQKKWKHQTIMTLAIHDWHKEKQQLKKMLRQ